MTPEQYQKSRGYMFLVYVDNYPLYTRSLMEVAGLVIENRGKKIEVVQL